MATANQVVEETNDEQSNEQKHNKRAAGVSVFVAIRAGRERIGKKNAASVARGLRSAKVNKVEASDSENKVPRIILTQGP